MSGITASRAALALSAIALFVALGGTAVAASQIGTKDIKNGAITSSKIKNRAVTHSKLANAAVTGSNVRDGSLLASDVAPNTFLAANGTAADSQRLGGLPANQYTQGRGSQVFRRAVVAPGGNLEFLVLGFATLTGNCSVGDVPTITFTPSVSDTNYFATIVTYPSTVSVDTLNAIPAGGGVTEPNGGGVPQMITYRDAYNDGVIDHVATATATGEYLNGTGCLFTGQGLTTG